MCLAKKSKKVRGGPAMAGNELYGFTDEELDFIINYDIKYRMGRAAGPGEEGDE